MAENAGHADHAKNDRVKRQQFRKTCLVVRYRRQSIHLREKNIVSPTEISIDAHASIKIAGKGLTFFDEDDVCAGL